MESALYFPKGMMDDPWDRWTRWLRRQEDGGNRCFRESQEDARMFLVASWQEKGEAPSHYLNNRFFNVALLNINNWSLFTNDDDLKLKKPRLHKNLGHTLTLIEQLRRQGTSHIGLMFWVQAGLDFTPPKEWILVGA